MMHNGCMSRPFTLPLGTPAPGFSLPSTEGQIVSLEDFASAKILVVFFTCVHCPYVTGSDERTRKVAEEWRPRGVEFVAINSNCSEGYPEDGIEGMKARMEQHRLPWPFLRDESQEAALAYGALKTPHFYVFDAERLLRYTGRAIDTPRDHTLSSTNELEDALEDLIEGREVRVPLTNPIGCSIKWKGRPSGWRPPEACDLA